jgi:hypothetical protein
LIAPTKLRSLAFTEFKKEEWGLDYLEQPQKNHAYVISADVSHGVGLDYSAFSVFDVTQIPYRQVAKYRNAEISPMLLPEVIHRYARWYNDAFVLVENNDIGGTVAETLHNELEYDNMLSTVMKGRAGQQISGGFGGGTNLGVRMSKQVKRIGCQTLKDMIESDKLLVQDFETIQELSTFVARRQSYEAEEGAHDDVVMTMVAFAWLTRQPFFRELTDTDIRARLAEEKYHAMLDDLTPPGFIDDGQSEDALSIERGRADEGFWSSGL